MATSIKLRAEFEELFCLSCFMAILISSRELLGCMHAIQVRKSACGVQLQRLLHHWYNVIHESCVSHVHVRTKRFLQHQYYSLSKIKQQTGINKMFES